MSGVDDQLVSYVMSKSKVSKKDLEIVCLNNLCN